MAAKQIRKVNRKIKHCEGILLKCENIRSSETATNTIFVGNGGLGCNIQSEFLMDVFSLYGKVKNIVMLPGKPYAFVVYNFKEEAVNSMDAINGQKLESGHIFYLSYIQNSDLPQENFSKNLWPPGLLCLDDFITEEEEMEILSAINFEESEDSTSLKHRRVRHYGFEFLYGTNNIDKNKSLNLKIPEACHPHLERLVSLGYIPRIPDQLTVNQYLPGQGIPPHIDTHSAFEDPIISISLGSQVVMDFYHPTKRSVPVLLRRRSALIMSDESRYLWKHGITPRKTDVIPTNIGESESLTLHYRLPRTSLTYRLIRQEACNCDYTDQCDSKMKSKSSSNDLVDEDDAKELELKYVNQVYEDIADHFSVTRYKPWSNVSSFLTSVPPGSVILDVGCGNGKNLGLSHGCYEIGCDASSKLAEVCSNRNNQVLVADCLKLPFRSNCADVVICIAVLHHLSTKARRAKAINEILRILRTGGKALIYVWAFEQIGPDGPSNYLKSNKVASEGKKTNNDNRSTEIELSHHTSQPKTIKMAVHENRTDFVEQDMLVPWKEIKSPSEKSDTDPEIKCHFRFYHVFVKGELENLVTKSKGHILSSYYDKGNWCIIFKK